MSLAMAVHHKISLAAMTVPIQQPNRKLGLEKEKKLSWQIHNFLDRNLIEPVHRVCNLPVCCSAQTGAGESVWINRN